VSPSEKGRIIALGTLLFGCVGCQDLIHLQDRYLTTTDASRCPHREPPPPPQVTGVGGTLEFVLAGRSSNLGVSGETDDAGRPLYQDIGFDLDHTCTGEGEGPSCLEPSFAIADHHDEVDGIDNAVGAGLYQFRFPVDPIQASPTSAALLIRVRAYSGGADDDQVQVCLFGGLGLSRPDGGDGPRWDGEDQWTLLPETLDPPFGAGTPSTYQPRFCDERAYVSGGTLVAKLADALWPGGLNLAPAWMMPIHGAVVAGRLSEDAQGAWRLDDGVVGFRFQVADALVWVARWTIDNNQPVCSQASRYRSSKEGICSSLDIASGADSPSFTCDALSWGVSFQAQPARLGDVGPPSPPLPSCAPGIDPANDSCNQ
jgi:hypothetical protein